MRCFAVVLVVALAGCSKKSDPADAMRAATVFIRTSEASGSGFLVARQDDDALIVTNAHVLRDATALNVVFFAGTGRDTQIAATTVVVDEVNDLALLRTRAPANMPTPLTGSVEVRELTKVVAVGFPFGDRLAGTAANPAPTFTRASVSSLRNGAFGVLEAIQLDNNLNPGNSGGPVLTESGEVLGVVVSGIGGSGISFAIPWQRVDDLLKGRSARSILRVPPSCRERCTARLEVEALDPLHRIKALELRVVDADESFLRQAKPTSAQGSLLGRAERPASGAIRGEFDLEIAESQAKYLQLGFVSDQTVWGAPFDALSVAVLDRSLARVEKPQPGGDGISIIEATYGANCGATAGNATAHVARSCNGKSACDYVVRFEELGDPAPNCAKTWDVRWQCGKGSPQRASLPPEAGLGSRAHLACEAAPAADGALEILSATYGGNCKAPAGNATREVAASCAGLLECVYVVDFRVLGDPAPQCAKDFVTQWRCGPSSNPRTTTISAEAGFRTPFRLSCL